MLINGKNVGFLKTVKVNFDIKAMCPNKDTNKLPELFDPQLIDVADVYANSMKFIMALNHGYEDNLHYYNNEYKQDYITEEDMMYLDDDQFAALLMEAQEAYIGKAQEMKTEPKKNNEEVIQ